MQDGPVQGGAVQEGTASDGRSVARRLRGIPRRLARVIWAYACSAVLAPVPRIRSATPGADPCAGSQLAAIYVSYDRSSRLHAHVVDQLRALARAGRRVIFITNSPRVAPELARTIGPLVREIVHRRNWGHDFGAFRDGIARLGDVSGLQSLLLMNDSCLGPFADLAQVETRAAERGCDLFGITDSLAHAYHLQTYYLLLTGRVVRSAAFQTFWRALLVSQPRSMVIFRGEIGFTQAMLRAGFSAGALCPYETVARLGAEAARRRLVPTLPAEDRAHWEKVIARVEAAIPLNPTHFFWDILLCPCGSPFLKRDLVERNPANVAGIEAWHLVVDALPKACGS